VLLTQNRIAVGAESIQAGRPGTVKLRGSEVILGPPLIINKANIDQFDF
jgi:rhamnose transport system permease protein